MAQSSIVSTDTKLLFVFTKEGLNTNQTIDIAQCLSVVNRRFYRQGMNYAVSSIEAFASESGARVGVGIIPTTWVADNSTTKAFMNWKEQRAEVLKVSPSLKAKWSDFKIFMDAQHAAAGTVGNLTPVDPADNPYLLGEWEASQFVVPVTGGSGGAGGAQEVTMHVVGDHTPPGAFNNLVTSSSLIKSYADSRSIVLAPDPVQPPGYNTNMYLRESSHDEMAADLIQNITNLNDLPPYDLDDYPGGDTNAPILQYFDDLRLNNFGDAAQFSSDSTGGLVVPFGLLRLQFSNMEDDERVAIVVNCVPGSYKGVMAEVGV
jgi:hypothetical protein